MSRKSKSSYLESEVRLLAQHFGIDQLRSALERISNGATDLVDAPNKRPISQFSKPARPSVTNILEELRQSDATKGKLLTEFYSRLKEKKVLPESQDIRHFAQLVGIKDMHGKSRKELLPKLIRFLAEQPTDRLEGDIVRASKISEEDRQRGFSIITDRLLSGR